MNLGKERSPPHRKIVKSMASASMDPVRSPSKMEIHTKAISSMDYLVDRVNLSGSMVSHTPGNSLTTVSLVKATINGLMAAVIKARSRMVFVMVLVSTRSMRPYTRATGLRVKNREMAKLFSRVEAYLKGVSKTI